MQCQQQKWFNNSKHVKTQDNVIQDVAINFLCEFELQTNAPSLKFAR